MNTELNLINRHNSNNIFWDFIDSINWNNLSKTTQENAINSVSEYLINNYTLDEIIDLQREEVTKRCEMEDFITNYLNGLPIEEREKYTLNDVETMDLSAHIIALGKTINDEIKYNPQMLFTLQNEYLPYFEESFDKAIYSMNISE